MASILNLAGDATNLDQGYWIGKGRVYPKDPPADLIAYCDFLYEIPDQWKLKLLPDKSIPVLQFISENLPSRKSTLIHIDASHCFLPDAPSERPESLLTRSLPDKNFVENTKAIFHQSILNGARSLCDPNYKSRPLPLWSVDLWDKMHDVLDEQAAWQRADKWLTAHTDNSARRGAIEECRGYLESTGWNVSLDIPAGRATLVSLAPILADSMISGHIVDLMAGLLSQRIETEQAPVKYHIVTLIFMDMIEKAWKTRNKPQVTLDNTLLRVESRLRTSNRVLLFPVHLQKEKHYVGFKIDFQTREISYGDSLYHNCGTFPSIQTIVKMLQWWLEQRWGFPFDYLGCELAHGHQQDGTSCGFTTVNMLAHEAMGEPLWNVSQHAIYRIQWFNHLMKAMRDQIRTTEVPLTVVSGVDQPGDIEFGHPLLPVKSNLVPNKTEGENFASRMDDVDLDNFEELPWQDDCTDTSTWLYGEFSSPISIPPTSLPASPSSQCSSLARDDRQTTEEGFDKDMNTMVDDKPDARFGSVSDEHIHPFFHAAKKHRQEDQVKPTLRDKREGGIHDESREKKRQKMACELPSMLGPVGIGSSVVALRKINGEVDSGTFIVNSKRWATFKNKIIQLDPSAEFDTSDIRLVRHSKCGEMKKMREPYSTENFKKHTTICKGRKKSNKLSGAGMSTIESLKDRWLQKPTIKPRPAENKVSCPGLTAESDSRIAVYLKRTNTTGGGAPRRDDILLSLFPNTAFEDLDDEQKLEVRAAQRHERKWRNERDLEKVYSTSCCKEARLAVNDPARKALPCSHCSELLKYPAFKRLLSMPIPAPENLKFTPKIWRESEDEFQLIEKYGSLGLKNIVQAYKNDPQEPCLLYAKGVIEGEFKDETIFTGLVEAMVKRTGKNKRGVGFQGFKYAPGVVEFAHIISTYSPRAYQSIRNVLQLPTERSHQINRARQPRFPIGITEETFEAVVLHLRVLDYCGPLCLSCDDTQLLPALRPYYDVKKKQHYLLGTDGEPMLLAEPEKFAEIIRQGRIKKATKACLLRLWCIQVPLPNVPTIIAAAKAIPSSLDADTLLDYSFSLLDGFLRKGLCIVAYAADGSSVERSVQNLLTSKAKKRRTIHFKHPNNGTITLEIPLFGENSDQPVVMVQDSQHGCKTARNASFSGARTLILGNYPVIFEDLRRLAVEGGPLFNRDVEKLDRQDDNAAIRLFSGDALQWLVEKYPNLLGPIIYLFIFGELIDAYQNRHINNLERVRMVFRAQFFIETWETFLNCANYPKGKYFLSKEACDIMKTLIQGLVKLVIVYRDLPTVYPLLLWLLSTEVCEHVFGLCRQILADFTVLDFYYMVPKLFVRLREAALLKTVSAGKERASGYNHMYHDTRNINLNSLSTYPTDTEIQEAIQSAYQESEHLWHLLGFTPDLNEPQLPSIQSWFLSDKYDLRRAATTTQLEDEPIDSDYENDVDEEGGEEELFSETRQIYQAIDTLENKRLRSFAVEDKVNNLTYAVVSLSVNDSMDIHNLDEYDAKTQEKILQEEALSIGNTIAQCLPPVIVPEEPLAPFDHLPTQMLNFKNLVDLRFKHQRKQAETGVRRWRSVGDSNKEGGSGQIQEGNNSISLSLNNPASTTRQRLLQEFNAVIKSLEEKGVSTAVGRTLRWQPGRNPKLAEDNAQSSTHGELTPGLANGNVLNAQEAAKKQSSALLTKRKQAFAKYGFSLEYATARVTGNTPLATVQKGRTSGSAFGYVLFNNSVMLAKVLSVYSKSGGKNGKHGRVEEVSSITAASNLPVQIFEHQHGLSFTDIPRSHRHLQLKRFALLSPTAFLINLDRAPIFSITGRASLDVSETDLSRYLLLKQNLQKLLQVQKLLSGRKKIVVSDNEED